MEKSITDHPEAPAIAAKLRQAERLHRQGRTELAEKLCREIVRRMPRHYIAWYMLGIIAGQRGRIEEAAKRIGRALAIQPDYPQALHACGELLVRLNRLPEALVRYDRLLTLEPGSAKTHNNRGYVLKALKRWDEALASFDRAIAIRPDYPGAWLNRALALTALNRFADALASYDQALALTPDDPELHNNRGIVLARLKRWNDAVAGYDRALAITPGMAKAHNNRGTALKVLRRPEAALACFEQALRIDPGFADAHYNEGTCRLLFGDFRRGWPKYEWRRTRRQTEASRRFSCPQWHGDAPLEGKTILLHAEQGMGDTIQFCRYAPTVAARGAHVLLEVHAPLKPLLATLGGAPRVLATGEPLPDCDYHCPIMSLPLAFRTELATVPAPRSYLSADPEKAKSWRSRLAEGAGLRIGIAWSGSPGNPNDHDRSIALRLMRTAMPPCIQLFSVQKEVRAGDEAALADIPRIRHFGHDLADFSDTAALVSLMDLVVAVDTSVAHLAAALGRPTWILLPYDADWRWLLERADSPWYPTARLFRQPKTDDWESVLRDVRAGLVRLAEANANGPR